MRQKPSVVADVQRPSTWVRYRARLCRSCRGTCCRLPVEVTVDDLVRMGVIDAFEAEEPPHRLARRLARQGVIEHYSPGSRLFTLARLANEDCIYLDPRSRRCTIYERRPETCRQHPHIGPRPGYCAWQPRQAEG